MDKKFYFYPLWLRLWHLLNAIMFLALIVTGLSMQYAATKGVFIGFKSSVTVHNICGIILSINYFIFIIANFASGNWKYYLINAKDYIKSLLKQIRYYTVGIFKHEPSPFPLNESRKFNPIQQFTYLSVMYFIVPVIIVTGIALMYPHMIIEQFFDESGLFITDFIHIIATFLGSIFMIVHIYFCTVGSTPISNFKSMVTGWHEAHD